VLDQQDFIADFAINQLFHDPSRYKNTETSSPQVLLLAQLEMLRRRTR
jgi:hypothetical protein